MDILVAVDLNDRPGEVLAHARVWGGRLGARLHLRAVVDTLVPDDGVGLAFDPDPEAEWQRMLPAEHAKLSEVAASLPAELSGTHEVVPGPRLPALVEAAAGFDLTVVGTHRRRNLARLVEGSVAAYVVRMVTRPVLVVPLDEPVEPQAPLRLLVGVDTLERSWSSVEHVRDWFGDGVELHVVHVEPEGGWPEAALWQERLATAGLAANVHAETGPAPAPALAQVAEALEPDLVVVRTHGRTGVARLLQGSVSERLLRLVTAPVLVLG